MNMYLPRMTNFSTGNFVYGLNDRIRAVDDSYNLVKNQAIVLRAKLIEIQRCSPRKFLQNDSPITI